MSRTPTLLKSRDISGGLTKLGDPATRSNTVGRTMFLQRQH